MCGQILVSRLPEGVKQLGRYKVMLSAQSQDQVLRTIESDSQGAFCFQVKPDDYSVQVVLFLFLTSHDFKATVVTFN